MYSGDNLSSLVVREGTDSHEPVIEILFGPMVTGALNNHAVFCAMTDIYILNIPLLNTYIY